MRNQSEFTFVLCTPRLSGTNYHWSDPQRICMVNQPPRAKMLFQWMLPLSNRPLPLFEVMKLEDQWMMPLMDKVMYVPPGPSLHVALLVTVPHLSTSCPSLRSVMKFPSNLAKNNMYYHDNSIRYIPVFTIKAIYFSRTLPLMWVASTRFQARYKLNRQPEWWVGYHAPAVLSTIVYSLYTHLDKTLEKSYSVCWPLLCNFSAAWAQDVLKHLTILWTSKVSQYHFTKQYQIASRLTLLQCSSWAGRIDLLQPHRTRYSNHQNQPGIIKIFYLKMECVGGNFESWPVFQTCFQLFYLSGQNS